MNKGKYLFIDWYLIIDIFMLILFLIGYFFNDISYRDIICKYFMKKERYVIYI